MADAYTTTGSLSFDQTMWNQAIYYALRPQHYFDMFADVKSTPASPDQGAAVTFTIVNDLPAATTPLSETVDVDAVAMSDSQVTLTLAEYGNAVVTTFRARATSFIPLNRAVANVVGENAGLSLDTLARNIIQGGTNVVYGGGKASRGTVAAADKITSNDVRKIYAYLTEANVPTFDGKYAAVIAPRVAYDLKSETGAAGWRDPHVYSDPQNIWNGEIGSYEGFRFMESPRAPVFVDAGATATVDVYATLFFGRQALAKAYSTAEGRGPTPQVVMGPVVDKLRRFQPVGWHWFGAYGVFRQAALWRLESSSSIGAN